MTAAFVNLEVHHQHVGSDGDKGYEVVHDEQGTGPDTIDQSAQTDHGQTGNERQGYNVDECDNGPTKS